MTDFLRDPIWQFIGVILAIIAIFVSIGLYILQKNKKSLSYKVFLDYLLVSKRNSVEKRVQIMFDGEVVQNISIFVIWIMNDGNVPILAADFVEPLNFSFGADAKIFEAEIVERYPINLKPEVIINKTNVELKPLLLNSGDTIILKLLLTKNEPCEANGRIVGVKELKKDSIPNRYLNYAFSGLFLTSLSLIWLFISSKPLLPFSVAIVGMFIMIFSILKAARQIKTLSEKL